MVTKLCFLEFWNAVQHKAQSANCPQDYSLQQVTWISPLVWATNNFSLFGHATHFQHFVNKYIYTRGDQNLVPATCSTTSNWFEFKGEGKPPQIWLICSLTLHLSACVYCSWDRSLYRPRALNIKGIVNGSKCIVEQWRSYIMNLNWAIRARVIWTKVYKTR